MRRFQWSIAAAVALVLVWIGATRDTSAQIPSTAQGSGRYSLSMVPVSAGNTPGYHAILLDTQTGRMWTSSGGGLGAVREFSPLQSPLDPHHPGTDKPEAAPSH